MTTTVSTGHGSVSINDAAPVSADIVAQGAQAATQAKAARDAARAAASFVTGAQASFPLAPNLLPDTKKFATLCGGRTNVPVEIISAHNGSAFGAALFREIQVTGTLEVVTPDALAAKGIGFGGDLEKATGGPGTTPPWRGSDFRVALFDVNITRNAGADMPGRLHVLRHPMGLFTGRNKGGFRTQTACFFNVVSRTGSISFLPSRGVSAPLTAGVDLKGKGWTYLHGSRVGWGETNHQPQFTGRGRMTVALALPCLGTGDHGGACIYAQSIGPYMHGDDLLPDTA